jgi:UDP-N-acetyl-2-amino-2-deoxyglucuronate dehydrogenase
LTITSKRAESLTGIDPTRINVILQLRISPMMLEIKKHIEELLRDNPCQLNVTMKYITPRGPWYHASWKGDENCSGGILMNIGIHLFDILIWLFGAVNDFTVGIRSKIKAEGVLSLQSAKVDWFLSLDWNDLPYDTNTTYRSLNIDGQDYRFDKVFADLHTQAYSHILEGKGFGPLDALPSIALVEKLNNVTQTAQPK